MKFAVASSMVLALATSVEGFVVPGTSSAFGFAHGSSSSLSAVQKKVDASALIAEALEVSKKFGASSTEARLAWEAVEEVNASDNR